MPDKRIVNLRSASAIKVLKPSLSGDVKNVELSTSQIGVCLTQGVRVEEVFEDGPVRLTLANYKKVQENVANKAEEAKAKKEQEEKARIAKEEAEAKAKKEQEAKRKAATEKKPVKEEKKEEE